MFKLLKGLGILAAVISTIGSASAASIFEDILVTFSGNVPFTLSTVSLALPPAGPNLITGFVGGATYSGSGTVLNEVVQLDSGSSYNFSFTGNSLPSPGTTFSGIASIFASTVPTHSSATIDNGVFNITVGAALSPVPLPAGFPLFAMGLIALGAFGYHSLRSRKNGEFAAAV